MNVYGSHDRELLESAAADLYELAVNEGGLRNGDDRTRGADEPAFDLLRGLGLLALDDEGRWTAQDPAQALAHVTTPINQEGARLLNESAEWSRAFGELSRSWRRAPLSSGVAGVTHLRGDAISPYLTGLVNDVEEEILTAQPQTGRDARALATAALRDTAALERGVAMRTLYQHSARRSTITQKYVAAVTARGAEVRTLDEFFNRLIVLDRRIAVIPGGDDLSVAVVVREPAIVAYLIDVFERAWERGRPFANNETATVSDIAAEQRAMTIRMLIEGHADPASAKRLGVSPRTFAGYISDLKGEFETETRFQLGYELGRRGVTGAEITDDGALEEP